VIKELNIISFDVPFPPNYGGVVEVFYKIKALHKLGVQIHLHCFEYGRGEQDELSKYCKTISYYKRNQKKVKLLSKLPFVVASRQNSELLNNLNKNDFPILIEGLHNCWFLNELKPSKRFVAVRTHNVEHDYYSGLAKVERSIIKKRFFLAEAKKLKTFEKVLKLADVIFAISPNDTVYFKSKFNKVNYVPAFHSGEEIISQLGKGEYAMYHGNLGVGENNEAAVFLIEAFKNINYPLVIAGSDPTNELIELIEKNHKISIKRDLSFTDLEDLIVNAHINILPTFQPTGIKLKLLTALFKGRFCVVNNFMVENTGLESACIQANSVEQIEKAINSLASINFTEEDLEQRKQALSKGFDNRLNASKIVEVIFKS